MSLIFATQLTAVATVALAVLALVTAFLAFLAWRKQSKEVRDQGEMLRLQSDQLAEDRKVNAEQIRVLGLQAEELKQVAAEREREALERRRAQAAQVFIWEEEGAPVCHIQNASQQPIHNVMLEWWDTGASRPRTKRPHKDWDEPLLPGREYVSTPRSTVDRAFELTATFRDNAGVWWSITQDGRPQEIPAPSPPPARKDAVSAAPAGDSNPDA